MPDFNFVSGKVRRAGAFVSGQVDSVGAFVSGAVESVGAAVFPVSAAPPPEYPVGVTHYFSGEDLPAEGEPINDWLDRLESVSLAQAGNATFRPVVALDGGYKSASFDGVNDFISGALVSGQPNSIMILCSIPASGVERVLLSGVDSMRNMLYWNTVSVSRAWAGTPLIGPVVPAKTKAIVAGVFNGASSRTRFNGIDTVGNAGALGSNGLRISNDISGSYHYVGKVYGILYGAGYNASAADLDEWQTFLQNNHGTIT